MGIRVNVFDNGKLHQDQMLDLGMIDVRFWKMYNAFYGQDSFIGTSLMEAKEEGFKHKNDGIKLKHDMCALVTGDLVRSFLQPKLGRNTTEKDMLEMKYVLEVEAATLQEFRAHNNGDKMYINMDTKVSATEPVTKWMLSQTAETYTDSLDAFVKKVTKFTVKEAY